MVKLIKMSVFKAHSQIVETPQDKTTRIVREIVKEEAELRKAKNGRLRNARLKRKADLPEKPSW
nr:hypothetical protein [Amylibacter sp.]